MSVIHITDAMAGDGIQTFYEAERISFAALTTKPYFGVTGRTYPNGFFFGDGDSFQASILELSRFGDRLELTAPDDGIVWIFGGAGQDVLASSPLGYGTRLDGGTDNDVLIGRSALRDHLLGRDGNDWLVAHGRDEMTGGGGADHFALATLNNGSIFITDLNTAPGKEQDTVSFYEGLQYWDLAYDRFSDAMAAGVLGVRYDRGYTYILFDADRDGTPEYPTAYIKGVVAPELYDTVFHTDYASSYSATLLLGDDIIDGRINPGQDHLHGENGDDVIIMGHNDQAQGGYGDDRFVLTRGDGNSAFITDFNVAIGDHDVVDVWKPLNDLGHGFDSFTQAQAAGILGIAYEYGYTKMKLDLDGDHVPEHQIAHIKGIVMPDQYNTVFSVSAANAWLAAMT